MNTIMLILAAPCVIVAVFAACRRDAPTAAAGVTGALLFAHPRRPHRRGRAPRLLSRTQDLRSTGPGLTAGAFSLRILIAQNPKQAPDFCW